MKKLLYIFLFFFCAATYAQKAPFYLMPQIGVLDGDQSTSLQFQVLGGVALKNWRIGMGTGMDYYKVRSVPVFADVRNYFGKNKKGFAYASVGYNVPWPLENQYKIMFRQAGPEKSKFEMGWYADLGVGYDISVGKQKAVSISLGYSMKTLSEKYDQQLDWIWGWPMPVGTPTEREVEYTFRRLALKAGFRLW